MEENKDCNFIEKGFHYMLLQIFPHIFQSSLNSRFIWRWCKRSKNFVSLWNLTQTCTGTDDFYIRHNLDEFKNRLCPILPYLVGKNFRPPKFWSPWKNTQICFLFQKFCETARHKAIARRMDHCIIQTPWTERDDNIWLWIGWNHVSH